MFSLSQLAGLPPPPLLLPLLLLSLLPLLLSLLLLLLLLPLPLPLGQYCSPSKEKNAIAAYLSGSRR